MPLSLLKSGETGTVKRITGKDDTKRFLESLGFTVGAPVSVISEISGNMVLCIRDTRIALNRDMARRIVI
ncbi:MAG: ferrous iron transport protein A [Clostridiales Family XIII bacterium]|jgi:ferrous iron transport protein A|nr:ferrous iron transport protein A [Clostridiales Family XIII bacterium]